MLRYQAAIFTKYISHSTRFNSTSTAIAKFTDSYAHSTRIKVCSRFAKNSVLFRPWFLRYIPKDGHELSIDYVDTMPDAYKNESVKTILILHNTPGSYYDYFNLLSTFGRTCRIIVPNFPNFNHTMQTGCFWHSAEEKSEFIVDFLKHLKVDTVDCLIAHSMAAYTASYLWIYANWSDYFKLGSVCLMSPVGMYKLQRREKLRLALMANLCRSVLFQKFLPGRWVNPSRLPAPKGTLSANFEIAAWKALTVHLSNYKKYHLRLRMLAHKQIPTLFTFSSNDSLYTPNVYYDQLFELGADSNNFDIYEQYENELIQSANDQYWIKAVDFRSSGHYMFNTHPEIIHSYISELLERSKIVDTKLIEQQAS